jgi:hypothetical protein
VLTGAQVEGSVIPKAMPAEGVVPEAEVITEATTQPTETAAPEVTEDVCDDSLPETSLNVVVRSLEIQDAEPIRSVPMSEAAVTSRDGLELLADDLINPATVARNLESKRRAEQRMEEFEEAALPIARLLVPHPSGPKIAPLVDRLKEAPKRLATYVTLCQAFGEVHPKPSLGVHEIIRPQGSGGCSRGWTSRQLHI